MFRTIAPRGPATRSKPRVPANSRSYLFSKRSRCDKTLARSYGMTFSSTTDGPPYPVSEAYGIEVVPTLVLVDAGTVADVVVSWDRDGWNRVVRELAERSGEPFRPVSEPGDGLPAFRPG